MPFEYLFKELLQQASTSGSRSTALKPLIWLVAILVFGVMTLAASGAITWLLIATTSLLGIAAFVFMGSYIYLMIYNPDALRSEKFTLTKMQIEKNLIGDDKAGLSEVGELAEAKTVSALPESIETKTISALPAKSEVAE